MTVEQRNEPGTAGAARRAGALALLIVLALWALWPQVSTMWARVTTSSDTVHAVIVPLGILLLILRRREALRASRWKESAWGIAFLVGGLALYAGATWPFSFSNVRDLAIVPILAGAVLVVYGRPVLQLSLPMLLLVLLSIPISTRLYGNMVGRADVAIMRAVAAVLDLLPGVSTSMVGPDLYYTGSQGSSAIAIGDSFRGVKLLLPMATVGVFVTFSRVRSLGRLVFLAAAAGPILLFCSFSQLMVRGLVAVYWRTGLGGTLDRSLSAILSLLVCYALFLLACTVRLRLFVERETDREDPVTEETAVQKPAQAVPLRGRVVSAPSLVFLLILVTAAIALRPAMAALAERYHKDPIAIRRPLSTFAISRLPMFREGWSVTRDYLPMEDIGTDEYCFFRLKGTGPAEPKDRARFGVSYYSKPGHMIPHSPAVCFVQTGAVIISDTTCVIDIPSLAPKRTTIPARLMQFKWGSLQETVIFCFLVEGEITTSRTRARWLVAKPGNRRTYFGLIAAGAMYPVGGDPSKAIETCKRTMRQGLPILLAEYFPQDEQLKHRE